MPNGYLIMQMIYTDFQPFLLSETDTWALSEDKAVELLYYLEIRGVRQVYCIPPVKKENPENTTEFLKGRFEQLQKVYMGGIELKLGTRYRLDGSFGTLLRGGSLLTIGEGRKLLVDVSPLKESADMWRMLEAIVEAGYTPIVMQPERTIYWSMEDFFRLKEMGCQLMLNLYSLFGYNGDEALNYSRMLLQKEMYTYLCSGMEDTKVMRYSEQMAIEEDMALMRAVQTLEKNNRLLWSVNENE